MSGRERKQVDLRALFADGHGAGDAGRREGRAADFDDARRHDRVYIDLRRAVVDGDLRPFDIHDRVGNAERGECGEDVLDRLDARSPAIRRLEHGAALIADDVRNRRSNRVQRVSIGFLGTS